MSDEGGGRGVLCYACGEKNERGLHMEFRREGDRAVCDYTPCDYQQGYPGRMHGGLVATLLDEAMGWAVYGARQWGATARLSVRFRRPVGLDQKLRVDAWITHNRSRLIELRGEVRDASGALLAEGEGTFMKLDERLASEMSGIARETGREDFPNRMSALVSPEWLQAHVGDPAVVVMEASVEKATYDAAHIPGARWVDVHRDMLLGGDDSSGHPIPADQFAALMSRLGVSPQTTVIWYGDRHSSLAIRGFWTMQFYRHPGAVHVLDGGRERWIAEGRPMTADVPDVDRADYPTTSVTDDSDRATIDVVRDAIGAPGAVLLDVRARDEYTGANRRAARGGHIPGAVHIEWTDATAAPNERKSIDRLRAMYEAQGVTPDKEIIPHCQLGIRAAHTWFVLKHVLGYPNVRNYDGSWQEWGNRDDTPIET